jgi:hypothetical protein
MVLPINNYSQTIIDGSGQTKELNTSTNATTSQITTLNDKIATASDQIKTNQAGVNTTNTISQTTTPGHANIISDMEQSFVSSFKEGDLDSYDPRAVVIAAQYTKMQFDDKAGRNKQLNSVLSDLGMNKLDDDVTSDIALQAIELIDAFEVDKVNTSANMQNDLFNIIVKDHNNFKNQNTTSLIDTDSLRGVFNITDIKNSENIKQVYTIGAYATSAYGSYTKGDQLTVSEMLADFSGQESEHDAGAYNIGSTVVNAGGMFSDHTWHNADKSNDAQLQSLKEKMKKTSPELLDLMAPPR